MIQSDYKTQEKIEQTISTHQSNQNEDKSLQYISFADESFRNKLSFDNSFQTEKLKQESEFAQGMDYQIKNFPDLSFGMMKVDVPVSSYLAKVTSLSDPTRSVTNSMTQKIRTLPEIENSIRKNSAIENCQFFFLSENLIVQELFMAFSPISDSAISKVVRFNESSNKILKYSLPLVINVKINIF